MKVYMPPKYQGPYAGPRGSIAFTIDHVQTQTLALVKTLVQAKIPVTVFVDPHHMAGAGAIYNVNTSLVTLGIHTLSKGASKAAQDDYLTKVNEGVNKIMGRASGSIDVLSYHGAGAGPGKGSRSGVAYARGINTVHPEDRSGGKPMPDHGSKMNSMVINNKDGRDPLATAYKSAARMIGYGGSAILFVHASEVAGKRPEKVTLDGFMGAVAQRKLRAVTFKQAMRMKYG